MTDGRSIRVPRPTRKSKRWTSFVAAPGRGRATRTLQEEANPKHRARVVHSQDTLLVQIADENGPGWTVIAIDRKTREWSVAQRRRQNDAAAAAYELLYE
jgi:ribosomal protein L18